MPEVLTQVDEDDFDDRLLFYNSEPREERQSEHSRLEREVIELVKADRLCAQQGVGGNADVDVLIQTRNRANAAVDALIAFESSQAEERR